MNSIESNFVPYQIALDMKSIGFDEPCLASWTYKTRERIPTLYGCGALLFDTDGLITNQTEDIICSAPLFQQAFRWFREKYYLLHLIIECNKDGSLIIVISRNKIEISRKMTYFNITEYEKAEFECLKKLIEICKKN